MSDKSVETAVIFLTDLEAIKRERDEIAARNVELVKALTELHAWSRPFIEKNSAISAETLWRRFPQAIEKARALLAKAKVKNDG